MAAASSSSSSPYRHVDPNDPYGFLFLEIGFVSDDQMELLSRAPILNQVIRPPPPAAAEAPPPPSPPPSPPPETVPPLTPISHEQPLPSIVAAPAAPVPATSTESPPHTPATVAVIATSEPTPSMPRSKKKTAASVPATATASASNPRSRPVVWLRDLLPPLPQGLSIAETVNVLWRERYPERDPETEPKSVVQVAKLKGFWWHGDKGAGSSSGANSRR